MNFFLQNEPKTLFLSKLVSVVKRRQVVSLNGDYFVSEDELVTKWDTRLNIIQNKKLK